MKALLTFILFSAIHSTCFAVEPPAEIPSEILPFAESGTIIIAWKSADLNGDGLNDYLIVLEQQKKNLADPDIKTKQRPVLIIVRQLDNSLKLVKRNDIAVSCSTCDSGFLVDGFKSINADKRVFSITNQNSGSAYETTHTYKFGYSKRDNTWQLIQTESHQERLDSGHVIKNIRTPPKDFGKIDFSDFDPDL